MRYLLILITIVLTGCLTEPDSSYSEQSSPTKQSQFSDEFGLKDPVCDCFKIEGPAVDTLSNNYGDMNFFILYNHKPKSWKHVPETSLYKNLSGKGHYIGVKSCPMEYTDNCHQTRYRLILQWNEYDLL